MTKRLNPHTTATEAWTRIAIGFRSHHPSDRPRG